MYPDLLNSPLVQALQANTLGGGGVTLGNP